MTEDTKVNPLTILPVKSVDTLSVDLTKETDIATELLAQAGRAEITDAELFASGGDLIKIAATHGNRVEDARKKLKAPFLAVGKFIDAQYNSVKSDYAKVRTTIEPKMLAWKRTEDERLRKIALAEAKAIEDAALEAAQASTEEEQDEVMDVAAEAAEKTVETAGVGRTYGNFGSTTSGRKVYSTEVANTLLFLGALIDHVRDGNVRKIRIDDIVELRKGGLNKLAQDMLDKGVKRMPGAQFLVEEKLRVG